MSQLDYQPMTGGIPVDPAPAGGAVTTLELYTAADRTGTPTSIGPPQLARPGVYRFTIDDAATTAGRYWIRVLWTAGGGGPTLIDDLPDPLDLPVRGDLVLSPEELAESLRIPLPLDDAQRRQLTLALLDAQDDVVAYLGGRAILPQVFTERRAWPYGGSVEALAEQPVWEVLSEVEETAAGAPTGYWTVTYVAGLNARADTRLRPIRRAVKTAAQNHDLARALWQTVGGGAAADGTGARVITSLSAEGQAVGFSVNRPGGTNPAVAEQIGGPVRWASIDRWSLAGKRVFQRGTRPRALPTRVVTSGL